MFVNIVLNKYPCLYRVISKSASTNIKRTLFKVDLDQEIHGSSPIFGSWVRQRRILCEDISGFNSHFRFTFVRDPWDRLHSFWRHYKMRPLKFMMLRLRKHCCKAGNYHASSRLDAKHLWDSFEEFIEDIVRLPDHLMDKHFIPQSSILANSCFDFIGKVESIRSDWRYVCSMMGAEDVKMLGMSKRNKPKKYRKFYNDDLRKLVEQRYFQDIVRFGYSF